MGITRGLRRAWQDLQADREIVHRIQMETGVAPTTSTPGLLGACQPLVVSWYGLAAPYLADVHEAICRTYAAEGTEAVAAASLGITVNHELAEGPLPPD